MKVALCLSGQGRLKKELIESIENNIVRDLNSDVFVHFWKCSQLNTEVLGYLINFPGMKSCLLEDQESFAPVEGASFNTQSMFKSIYKCNELKKAHESKNNFKYDLVIRCRPDLRISQALDKESLKDLSKLWAGEFDNRLCDDQFFYSNSGNIDLISNIFYKFSENPDSGPERILSKYVKSLNIETGFIVKNYYLTRI